MEKSRPRGVFKGRSMGDFREDLEGFLVDVEGFPGVLIITVFPLKASSTCVCSHVWSAYPQGFSLSVILHPHK